MLFRSVPSLGGVRMTKIKCYSGIECEVCHIKGMLQIFFNREGNIKYARIRHYSHIDKQSHKPQFTYCKIEDIESLKTLLKSQGISLSIEKAESGQIGQSQSEKECDLDNSKNSLIQQNTCGRRLVWFRTLAFQANDPGFKSRRPHLNSGSKRALNGISFPLTFDLKFKLVT